MSMSTSYECHKYVPTPTDCGDMSIIDETDIVMIIINICPSGIICNKKIKYGLMVFSSCNSQSN